MTLDVAPDVEQFINDRIAAGKYADHDAVLRAACALLERRESVLERIDRGTAELSRGEGKSLATEEEWDAFFDDLIRRGLDRNSRAQHESR